jgi:alanine racemase
VVILSDFEQTGLSQQELYSAISQQLEAHGIDTLYAVGRQISEQKDQFNIPSFVFPSTEKLLDEIKPENLGESIILIKAARSFKFERILQRLQEKAHDTVLEIDLEKVIFNINQFRSILPAETGIIAMVKAFSYGSGSVEIAKVLEYQRIAYLAVAYTDEGVALRKAGINLPILVLNPERSSFDAIIRFRLEPEIYSKTTLLNLKKELVDYPEKWPWPVHIKLETGMNRLGFTEAELDDLCALLQWSPELKVVSIFSHLAASEDAQFDWFTKEQIARFKRMSHKIESSLNYPVLKHIANSAGMLRFPESRFDMVRLGIGMYGIEPGPYKLGLQPVSRLRTIVSQVRTIAAGESVGYGRSFIAEKDMQIAVLPIGYADGYRRSLGRGAGKVCIKGHLCSVIGNVCMDMLMVDVSGLGISEGDEVIVFGDNPTVNELAKWAGTIAYEILTSVSPRVKRVFIQEGI